MSGRTCALIFGWTAGAVICLLIGGCKDEKPATGKMPPMAVEAVTLEKSQYKHTYQFIGSVKPLKSVKLVARVDGFLRERYFEGGALVKAGDKLYQIESTPYELALKQAQAKLDQARADAWNAQLNYQRTSELFHEKISSLREYDQAQADCKSSSAAVAAAEAALGQAGLNLGYTTIIAPFDGWVGINTVDSGNYLSAPSQTLAEVLYINQVKVEFHLSDAYLNGEFRRAIVSGVPPAWPVYLQLRNGEKYPLPGKISFWENEISSTTASITVQALFDNPDYLLLPGLYVTVILENPVPEEVLLLDRRSLRNEQGNYFVMLITPRQTLEFRPVEVGDVVGEKIIIRSGLTAGEQVAIAGNVLLQPGTKVNVIGSKK